MNLVISLIVLGFFISKLKSIRVESWLVTIEFWPTRGTPGGFA